MSPLRILNNSGNSLILEDRKCLPILVTLKSPFNVIDPIPVNPGFTLYIFDCTSSLYAEKVLVTNSL
jgi:hypothetical protein